MRENQQILRQNAEACYDRYLDAVRLRTVLRASHGLPRGPRLDPMHSNPEEVFVTNAILRSRDKTAVVGARTGS